MRDRAGNRIGSALLNPPSDPFPIGPACFLSLFVLNAAYRRVL